MSNIRKISVVIFLLGIVVIFLPINSLASEVATGFTYEIKFPDNQLDNQLNYYHLMMEPGQEEELTLILSNPSTEKVTVDLKLTGAKTNSNGVIEWANDTIPNDKSLMFKFEDIVSGPEKVVLDGGETKEIKLNIKMPETSYDGIITGGIQLIKSEEDSKSDMSNGSKVINRYAYAISIVLQETEKEVLPDLKYNRTYAGQLNYRNTIMVNLSNLEAAFLNKLTIESQISKKGSKEVLYEAKKTGMRMAPNSFIDFPISMNGEKMVAGNYVARILATSGDQRWEWEEDFKITADEADKYNAKDVGLVQDTAINWWFILMIILGIMILFFIIFVVVRLIRLNQVKQKKKKYKK